MTDILNETLRDHVMLVSVHISHWRGEVKDVEAAKAAAAASGASGAGAFTSKKHLMYKNDERLKKVQSLGNAARSIHNDMTLAWDTGMSPHRMLPVTMFTDYTKAIAKAKKEYGDALEDFIAHYEADSAAARAELNLDESFESRRLYPKVEELRTRFNLSVEFEPIAEGTRFRNIPDSAAAALGTAFESRIARRFKTGLRDAYDSLAAVLTNLRENLMVDADERAQRWKDSSVYNIVEKAALLATFNLESDPDHDKLCEKIESYFGSINKKDMAMWRKPGTDRQPFIDKVTECEVILEGIIHAQAE